MESVRCKMSAILSNLRLSTHQSVRFKGMQRKNRTNWRPIPPKTERGDYYKLPEYVNWTQPILNYKETLAKKSLEPPPEPRELHLVTRCKRLKGETEVCKRLCEHFGMDKAHKQVVVANTPFNNTLLMQIKHLIRVKPVVVPDNFPEDSSDLMHTQLLTDGTLKVIKKLDVVEEKKEPVFLLSSKTVNAKNCKVVRSHRILADYCKTKYTWRYNEDGTERPYKAKQGS